MCGGTPAAPYFLGQLRGLSPLVRENLMGIECRGNACGSIPVCEGEPT